MNYYDKALENLKNENYDVAADYFFSHLYCNNSIKDYPPSEYLCKYNHTDIITEEIRNNVKEYYRNIIEQNQDDNEIKASSYARLGMILFYIDKDNFMELFNLVYNLSNNYFLLNNIGLILLKNGKRNESVQFLEKAKKISNSSIPEIVFNLHTAYSYNN
ncbi:hypothetical protein SZ47_12410 [Brachyspira hyodysenteriae]|uniref:Tetratricopeptide repeat protein n=1 Tax=Brachyspira hyodysenteriae ATCC 27164 TaxID=1266923 RepID=A0A3B6VXL7_BRAHO|nr:hypothetical protein [Brachyspira hyodysenteriae]ANN64612.1 hypothetical protein BHYOB78_12295 [Brachyspira hyodysenteriae ATCC 27164]KLI22777.1 hypothetical protein SZ47_12410 [Brachyspira hyodysenteriae]